MTVKVFSVIYSSDIIRVLIWCSSRSLHSICLLYTEGLSLGNSYKGPMKKIQFYSVLVHILVSFLSPGLQGL